jgi:hypothetical protein
LLQSSLLDITASSTSDPIKLKVAFFQSIKSGTFALKKSLTHPDEKVTMSGPERGLKQRKVL